MSSSTSSPRTKHATLRYTAARLGIFLACFVVAAVLTYFGVVPAGIGRSNPLWVAALALVLSAPISYVALRRQREAMAGQLVEGVARAKQRLERNRSQEDEADDDARAAASGMPR